MGGITLEALLTAGLIATGSTCQALFGREIAVRIMGLPLQLTRLNDTLKLFARTGPLACPVAPTAGINSLYVVGGLPAGADRRNWLTWWAGDSFGFTLFLPRVLVAPGGPQRRTWC